MQASSEDLHVLCTRRNYRSIFKFVHRYFLWWLYILKGEDKLVYEYPLGTSFDFSGVVIYIGRYLAYLAMYYVVIGYVT